MQTTDRKRRLLVPLVLCCLVVGCTRQPSGPTTRITLDGSAPGRVFDGIGAVSAGASSRLLIDYPEPYRSQILDYLFKPNYGASLQHLKVEIGSDVNSTDGSEPSFARTRAEMSHPDYSRGYELWLMEEAVRRNPQIILDSLAWGAPGWIGNGHFYSQDMANYVVKFIQGATKVHHLDVRYTGIWNEKQYQVGYVKLLKKTLLANALTTKVVCCDLYPSENQWSIIHDIERDPDLAKAVAVIGVHYPRVNGRVTTPQIAKKSREVLWSSEDGPWRGDWKGAEELAKIYNENYIEGRLTGTEIWSPVTSYYGILPLPGSGLMYANTPWSGHYEVQPAIWVTAHTTQFAQPGWRYLNSSCGFLKGQGSYVALKSPSGKNYSVIIETVGAKGSQRADFRLTGGLPEGTVHVWETNKTRVFGRLSDLTPHNGSFSIALEPDSVYSLTTTVGQSKGTASPPPSVPFPFPYTENFETTAPGTSPKYFSDQDGAFEVWPCRKRAGRCLFQVITRMPISWGATPDPFTMLGDAHWTDYQVSSDVMLGRAGTVALLGRIDSANMFEDSHARWPSAYILTVRQDGTWDLLSAQYKHSTVALASGRVIFSLNQWHHVALIFKGPSVHVLIDHSQVASVIDRTHTHGMVGIGSGWNRAEFDNFVVR